MDQLLLKSYLLPNPDEGNRLLRNTENSFKIFYHDKKRLCMFENELIRREEANRFIIFYLKSSNFKSENTEKSYKHCQMLSKQFEETISFKTGIIKQIYKKTDNGQLSSEDKLSHYLFT